MGVEHVRYEGRLGVKRRRWTTGEIISDAYGHVCRLYARIRCFMGPIWHLVGPWECTGRWLDSWCSSGLSTDMLVVLTPAPRSAVFGPSPPSLNTGVCKCQTCARTTNQHHSTTTQTTKQPPPDRYNIAVQRSYIDPTWSTRMVPGTHTSTQLPALANTSL